MNRPTRMLTIDGVPLLLLANMKVCSRQSKDMDMLMISD